MITKKLVEELKIILEKEKKRIEGELKTFAEKGSFSEDWQTMFPYDYRSSEADILEGRADEVEEYENLLAIEQRLEIKLKNIKEALKKIKEGKYGVCEKCGKEIEVKRLKVLPDAKFCKNCIKK